MKDTSFRKMLSNLGADMARAERKSRDIIRRCRFAPYRKGMGPTFSLTMWDTGRVTADHRTVVGYELKMSGKVLFSGEDFYPSLSESIDGDAAVASLMTFLTLRPGDTDSDYFANYTADQMSYAETHAESLSCEVLNRFEKEGR